jgi:hypothetical protein
MLRHTNIHRNILTAVKEEKNIYHCLQLILGITTDAQTVISFFGHNKYQMFVLSNFLLHAINQGKSREKKSRKEIRNFLKSNF